MPSGPNRYHRKIFLPVLFTLSYQHQIQEENILFQICNGFCQYFSELVDILYISTSQKVKFTKTQAVYELVCLTIVSKLIPEYGFIGITLFWYQFLHSKKLTRTISEFWKSIISAKIKWFFKISFVSRIRTLLQFKDTILLPQVSI